MLLSLSSREFHTNGNLTVLLIEKSNIDIILIRQVSVEVLTLNNRQITDKVLSLHTHIPNLPPNLLGTEHLGRQAGQAVFSCNPSQADLFLAQRPAYLQDQHLNNEAGLRMTLP
jgi:hypothetical protein